MNTQFRFAAVALSLCVAAPAFAMGAVDPLADKGAEASLSSSAPASAAAPAKKICHRFAPLTGTRIPTVECRTREEWLADGYKLEKRKGKARRY